LVFGGNITIELTGALGIRLSDLLGGGFMLFKIKADAEFEADDIDDAFEKLAAHFKGLAEKGLDKDSLFVGGDINISPC
jgi:hypothetical protein